MRAAAAFIDIPDALPDPAALLGERAALEGLRRNAPVSVGGAFRALRAADGWFGLSLSRASDIDLVPALVEAAPDGDYWSAVTRWLANQTVAEAAERVRLLGMPGGPIPADGVEPLRPAVEVGLGGSCSGRSEPRVVDLSALWAGPLCSHLLSMVGAHVVKVESLTRPDGSRGSMSFERLHAGKEMVKLDFGTAHGRAVLFDLVASADIVVTSARPRALQQLGLDPAAHSQAGAVWVAITAYGMRQGDRVGFGDDVAAAGGLVAFDGEQPYPVGDAIADPLTGMTAAAAAIVALRAGIGCVLDVSMRDVVAAAAALPSADAEAEDREGAWWVVTEDGTVPVREPRAR